MNPLAMNKRDFIKVAASAAPSAYAGLAVAAQPSAMALPMPTPKRSLSLAAWQDLVGESFEVTAEGLSMRLRLDRVEDHSAAANRPGSPQMEQFSLVFGQVGSSQAACSHAALATGTCQLHTRSGRSQGLFLQPAGQTLAGAAQWHAPVSRFA